MHLVLLEKSTNNMEKNCRGSKDLRLKKKQVKQNNGNKKQIIENRKT